MFNCVCIIIIIIVCCVHYSLSICWHIFTGSALDQMHCQAGIDQERTALDQPPAVELVAHL